MLLVSWTTLIDLEPQQPYEVLEFFSGHAKIARYAQINGYKSAAIDILYDEARPAARRYRIDKRSPFDLNSEAGFASPRKTSLTSSMTI